MKFLKLFLIILFASLVLSGCASSDSEEMELVEETVSSFLNAYKSKDEKAGEYLTNNISDAPIEFKGFQGVLAENIEFDINTITYENEKYLVKLKIKNLDFAYVFEKVMEDSKEDSTEEEIINKLEVLLNDEDVRKKEFECNVLVNLVDDQYKIEMSPELSNAMLGGFNEYISDIIEEK